ncbi:MAG: nucleoside monophosphate kinase, partial [Nitrososphaerota archaeon]|nr:nucleoside monophosphate kinase [Nitrososphaerota archaeon]
MKLIIFGPPGSGKGTYASRISPIFNIPHISTGDILREEVKKKSKIGIQAASYVESGQLVPDDLATFVLKRRLKENDCKNGFILDGYPRTLQQAMDLEKITKIDVVINLSVPDWLIVKRLSAREVCKNCGAIYNKLTLRPKVAGKCDKC